MPDTAGMLAIVAPVCAAANMILIRFLGRRYGAWTLTVMQVVTGCLFFIPDADMLDRIGAGQPALDAERRRDLAIGEIGRAHV